MKECTIDELIKSNRLCASGDCGSECYFYIYDEFCQDELKAHSAKYLESQQKEIDELKKQIAETYTLKQAQKDHKRLIRQSDKDGSVPPFLEDINEIYLKDWAKSHPEKPKVTNMDKFREVFGAYPVDFCFHPEKIRCIHPTKNDVPCSACEYGINGEYKEPSDK